MRRPSFQFYPGDWASNPNLLRCSFALRGIWMAVLCLAHDQEEYGVLRWPLKDIAQAVGCRVADLQELARKGVLKGSDETITEPFIYTPRSGRKDGDPVTLIPAQVGPLWYSSRMVKDEYVRTIRGDSGGNGEASKATPKHSPKAPIGAAFGPRGSSSPSSPSGSTATPDGVAPAQPAAEPLQLGLDGTASKSGGYEPPDCPHREVLALWAEVLPEMPQHRVDQWNGARADHLRARWRTTAVAKKWPDQAAGLDYFRRLFGYVQQSDFLCGRVGTAPGKRSFLIELEWLVNATNWAKVHEGKYHREEQAA